MRIVELHLFLPTQKRRSLLIFSWFFLLFWTLACPAAFAADELVINSGNSDPFITADGKGFYGLLSRELCRRMKMHCRVIRLPSPRALINANAGIEDGNIARIAGMEKIFPNLIRVPEPVVDFVFIAYRNNAEVHIESWDSFQSYDTAFVNGWKILEKNITKTKSLIKLRNVEQMFRLLEARRVDVVVYEYWGGLWWSKNLGIKVHAIQPPLARRPMYIYLHKKHKHLVLPMMRQLRRMKKDGSYQRIFDKTLAPLARH